MDPSYVILLSGGLDSGSLLFWAIKQNYNLLPLYVNYGQVPFPGEYMAVQNLLKSANLPIIMPLDVNQISTIGTGTLSNGLKDPIGNQYFPSRNLFLLTLAAMYAYTNKVSRILIGLIGDASGILPDCSKEFIDKAEVLLQVEYPHIKIETPFLNRSKISIVQEAIEYGLVPEATFCCNRLPNHHCWRCPSCIDRLRVLEALKRI